MDRGSRQQQALKGSGVSTTLKGPGNVTLGFRPTCSCDGETGKAVILDLFCGTGTVCWQADQLGRDWIGIDIDPKSIKMAEERLRMGPVEYETMEEKWIQPQLTI